MPTWEDLESRFTLLQPEIGRTQIHYQTGEDRRSWLADGTPDVYARFNTVAKAAGLKLLEVDSAGRRQLHLPAEGLVDAGHSAAIHDLVRMRSDPLERWHEALRRHSDYFREGANVLHQPRDGIPRPSKFGSVSHPALASIWVCKHFATAPVKAAAPASADKVPALEHFLRREVERRGTTWKVLGIIFGWWYPSP